MTIQEAVKSGKKFRRSGWYEGVHFYINCMGEIADNFDDSPPIIEKEDILAEDWEVKE